MVRPEEAGRDVLASGIQVAVPKRYFQDSGVHRLICNYFMRRCAERGYRYVNFPARRHFA